MGPETAAAEYHQEYTYKAICCFSNLDRTFYSHELREHQAPKYYFEE
jgi:hypothetical protein